MTQRLFGRWLPLPPQPLHNTAIPSLSRLSKTRYARDRCRTGSGIACDSAIGHPLLELLTDFQTLTPGLELAEGPHIPQEISHLLLGLADGNCLAEVFKPRMGTPGGFGEAFSHRIEED